MSAIDPGFKSVMVKAVDLSASDVDYRIDVEASTSVRKGDRVDSYGGTLAAVVQRLDAETNEMTTTVRLLGISSWLVVRGETVTVWVPKKKKRKRGRGSAAPEDTVVGIDGAAQFDYRDPEGRLYARDSKGKKTIPHGLTLQQGALKRTLAQAADEQIIKSVLRRDQGVASRVVSKVPVVPAEMPPGEWAEDIGAGQESGRIERRLNIVQQRLFVNPTWKPALGTVLRDTYGKDWEVAGRQNDDPHEFSHVLYTLKNVLGFPSTTSCLIERLENWEIISEPDVEEITIKPSANRTGQLADYKLGSDGSTFHKDSVEAWMLRHPDQELPEGVRMEDSVGFNWVIASYDPRRGVYFLASADRERQTHRRIAQMKSWLIRELPEKAV